jgi:hypothetical protein
MNCMTEAETQLNAALRTSRETELWTFANLNLAIVYLRQYFTANCGTVILAMLWIRFRVDSELFSEFGIVVLDPELFFRIRIQVNI